MSGHGCSQMFSSTLCGLLYELEASQIRIRLIDIKLASDHVRHVTCTMCKGTESEKNCCLFYSSGQLSKYASSDASEGSSLQVELSHAFYINQVVSELVPDLDSSA